jgi:hypothetical protein
MQIQEDRIDSRGVAADDPVDPPAIVTPTLIGAFFEFLGYPIRMLDHCTMHIDDVDTRVGALFEVDGSEPRISAGEPLRIALRLPVGSHVRAFPKEAPGRCGLWLIKTPQAAVN